MSFGLPLEVEELREAAARFAERDLAPAAREAEAAGRWSPAALGVLDGFALGGLDLPVALGGVDGGSLAKVVALEALAHGDPGGLPAADRPGPAAGAVVACPEPDAVDLTAPLVVGERVEWAPAWPPFERAWVSDGDDLRLVTVGEPEPVLALAFAASGGVTAPLGEVLGEWTLPAGGGAAVRGRARLWAAAVALGVAQAALDATVAYTTERVVFGKPVAHHQGNAFELAVAATDVHAARLVVHDAADRTDRGDPTAGFWSTQAWVTTIETAVRVTDLGIQLLGGHGFLVDHLAEKRFREARMLGLLLGGRDAADADLAGQVLDVDDPVFR